MNWGLLLIAACIYTTVLVRAQLLECNFQQVDLLPCLTKTSDNTAEACCLALNQALKAGHHCLCSLLSYTSLQLTSANSLLTVSPFALSFPGCALYSPSLASCGAAVEPYSPPVPTKEPVLTPMATAPPPRTKELSTNSTQAPTGQPLLHRTSKNIGPLYADNRAGARLQMCKSLVWLISICAWIVFV